MLKGRVCLMCLVDIVCVCGSLGGSGLDRAELPKITFFFTSFFEGIFFIFTSFLDHFLKVFSYFFHLFFELFFGVVFFQYFSHFFDFIFLCKPSPTRILLQPASV